MNEMTHMGRVTAVLSGDRPDRPPVSFWYHFPPEAAGGQAAVDAHLEHLGRYDLDFLKVMNDSPYPISRDVTRAADLRDLPVLNGDEEGFGVQLELIRTLARELSGEVLIATTILNAWATLRRMVHSPRGKRHGPPTLSGGPAPADSRISELLAEDRSVVARAIDAISTSLANFAGRCIETGADGIFLSVRDDWVNTPINGVGTYDEMVRAGDLRILSAANGARFNILHVCGVPQNFDAFADYPIAVINWADRAAGPAIGEVIGRIRPVVCGGVDNLATLAEGTPAAVEGEVGEALRQAGDHPMIVGPGCTFDPKLVPEENLDAMVGATRGL